MVCLRVMIGESQIAQETVKVPFRGSTFTHELAWGWQRAWRTTSLCGSVQLGSWHPPAADLKSSSIVMVFSLFEWHPDADTNNYTDTRNQEDTVLYVVAFLVDDVLDCPETSG